MPGTRAARHGAPMTRHRPTPILTLIAMVLVGSVLLIVNIGTEPDPAPRAAAAVAAARADAPERGRRAWQPPPEATDRQPAVAAVDPFPSPRRYAGATAAGGLGVAVDVRHGRVAAYLCDGVITEAWLRGPAPTGSGDRLTLATGYDRLVATLDGRRLTGRVFVGGQWHPFVAAPVDRTGPLTEAGLTTLGATS
jgi:hypothetical protein